MKTKLVAWALGFLVLTAWPVGAAEPVKDSKAHDAIVRGLQIVQKAAANYPKHRNCFSCHHQTLPMQAMISARDSGFSIDNSVLQAQADFTHKSFKDRIKDMKEGVGIGGRSMTVAYGLWALDLAGWKKDETTEAMVTYLLKNQKEDGHWPRQISRPPLEDSNVTCTVLAAYGMQKFATPSQREQVKTSIAKAKNWLAKADLKSQEDQVARLWGIHLLDGPAADLQAAQKTVLSAQRTDGGWSQLVHMSSDAYATGQTLFVLQLTGMAPTDAAYQRGLQYLLKTQCPDGSWLVETRSRPVQTFFDNGDPHGKHQFISVSATGWAVAAIAAANQKAGPANSGQSR